MVQAKMNDKVKVHYKGSLADGTVFDSSEGSEPLEFVIGQGMVIPGFENGIVGMSAGDRKTIVIPPNDGYGEYDDELVTVIDRAIVPPTVSVDVGTVLQVRTPDGGIAQVVVKECSDTSVTLDLNHPLAGKEMVFEVQLMEVVAG